MRRPVPARPPRPLPPQGLPVEDSLPALRRALAEPGLAVLQAAPGAGKTTVVPLRLLAEPWLGTSRIVVLEPRRVAARAAARRMASLIHESVGETVGYRTRDDTKVGDRTRIEVVTEGILTRRLQRDPALTGVGLVMFDEFHERSLQADLGLALALDARGGLRGDLRILVASATLDGGRVAALLGGDDPPAPVVSSAGRDHPVEVIWRPRQPRDRLEPAIVAAVSEALSATPGDVLAFLPGAASIDQTQGLLADVDSGTPVDVHRLFGALSAAEQDAALAPGSGGARRVVLATDIAETSLTVEGVTAVVDSGLSRIPQFDPGTGMTRLTTRPISQASADQRAGRAGRTAPGVVLRLWSQADHATRRPFAGPEITQVDLSGLALELAVWGVGDPADLAFLDPPPAAAWAEAGQLLDLLGALDADRALTAAGRAMAGLPLHPRLARMVVGARSSGRGWLACVLAALLDEGDIMRGRPDDLPVDLSTRAELVADTDRSHPRARVGALRATRRRARDIARRAEVSIGSVDSTETGRVLMLGYPDRIGQRRGSGRGRFRLRTGSGAWMAETDVLAGERFVVVADLDGQRRDARIRQAAAVDEADLAEALAGQLEDHQEIAWDPGRGDVVARREQRLGALRLGTATGRAPPGPEVVDALVERARNTELAALSWTAAGRGLQRRVEFLARHQPGAWPDVSDAALLARLDQWLPALLPGATGRADLEAVDTREVIRGQVRGQLRDVDRLAPTRVTVGGRPVAVDYRDDPPIVAIRVQRLFGTTSTPALVDGQVQVVLHLLSPADRPIQITTDLAGFWSGSWAEVRKEMAGRYPKHDWPADPGAARAGG